MIRYEERGRTSLRSRSELCNQFGQPVFQNRALIGRHFGKRKAHSESSVAVRHPGFGFEDAAVSKNSQMDQRSFREWV